MNDGNALPHHSNALVVHHNVNVTAAEIRIFHMDVQAEEEVVIGCCWTREYRGIRVVGATFVCHHVRRLNDFVISWRIILHYASRETNEICRTYNSMRYVLTSDPSQSCAVCVARTKLVRKVKV